MLLVGGTMLLDGKPIPMLLVDWPIPTLVCGAMPVLLDGPAPIP